MNNNLEVCDGCNFVALPGTFTCQLGSTSLCGECESDFALHMAELEENRSVVLGTVLL